MNCNYLIVGGTSGIGRSIVERVLRDNEKASIVVTYGHNDEAVKSILKELPRAHSERITFIKSDLSKRDNIDLFCEKIASHFSEKEPIDRLVLNIGIGNYKSFDDYQFEDWDRVMETNLTIPIFIIQQLKINNMLAPGASILLMSSQMASVPHSSSLVYSVSKAGLSFAARLLVKEFEASSIRINALEPGFVETRWHANRTEESRKRINAKIALHRFAFPEEIADAAVFLLENTYMNGSVVTIDGGYNYF